jgi:hypothetical protein
METQELIKQLRDFRNVTENWVLLKRLMEAAADKIEEQELAVIRLQHKYDILEKAFING